MAKYDSQGVPILGFHNPAGMILYPEGLFSYSMGNTRARDLTELISTSTHQQLDLLLLASGDVRNILYTASEMSLRKPQERAKCLNFHLNDYDPTIVARNAVLLEVASSIDPNVAEDLDFLWNIWYNMALSESDFDRLQNILSVFAEKNFDGREQCILRFDDVAVLKECRDIWKDWRGLDLDLQSMKVERKNYMGIKLAQKGFKVENQCHFVLSQMTMGITSSYKDTTTNQFYKEIKHWFEEGSTNDESEKVNPTLIRPFVHKWKQHYCACPFEGYLPFESKVLRRCGSLTGACKETLQLLVKRYRQYRSHPSALMVTLWTGDALSLCTSGLPPEQLFDVIDSSNAGDHIGLLNVLVCCAPRLKMPGQSILFTSSMLWSNGCQSIEDFYNQCVGVPFHLLPTLLGLKLAVDLELGSSKLPDRMESSEEILCWVKAEAKRSILTIDKNSDILKGLLRLLERCFNLPNVPDAQVYGVTLSSPLTFLRIVHQIQPLISGGATCIFDLLESELPADFHPKFGLSWNLLKASVGSKQEPIVEIQVSTKIPLAPWCKGTPLPSICIARDRQQFESVGFQALFGLPLFSMEPPYSVIYHSLRYDDIADVATFHLCEKDWNQLKSRGWMWFSSCEFFEVIECHKIFLGDGRVKNIGRVDPVQIFCLNSEQSFNIVDSNESSANILKVLKVEESQFFYSAQLGILDPVRFKTSTMKVSFEPDRQATKVSIDFEEHESEKRKKKRESGCTMCFSCCVDGNSSKFQISRKQGKIFCHIPKSEEGTVGELVIQCPAPVPFHALPLWDISFSDSAGVFGYMFRTSHDLKLKREGECGPPFFDLRESLQAIMLLGHMKESKPEHNIYCIDELGVIEKPYDTPVDMAAKRGFVIKVQEIYKWKKLPVAKVLFFDCQRFAERFSNVSTAEKTMFAFLSVALFSRKDRLVSSQQETALLRKLLYTNAARVPQSSDSDLWKSSFLSPLFPRELADGYTEVLKGLSNIQFSSPEDMPTEQPQSNLLENLFQQEMASLFSQVDPSSAMFGQHKWCSPLEEAECAFCHSKPAEKELKKCMGCKKVFYCGKECQKKHWSDHRADCRA
ncbi:uncharacterized protein [Montipora capricornis]|uniref:uncharacterized protein isoform X2 n=1 Tax=Montipora capricornis TaxID=246305 RepID=UPI0035F15B43